MFLTENNVKKCLLFISLISLMMMVFITSCADMAQMMEFQPTTKIDVPPPQTPQLQTFKTSSEYLKAAKASFDAQRFDEAQAYLSEAVRLDQKNQAAHLLLGVTYVKLGKGAEARREFDRAVQIDPKTGDAETAKSWVKRLDNKLGVGILPVKQSWSIRFSPVAENKAQLEWKAGKIDQFYNTYFPNIEQIYYRTLSKILSDCGFYSIIDFYGAEPVEWKHESTTEKTPPFMGIPMAAVVVKSINTAKLNNKSNIANFKNTNAKIILIGDIDLFVEEKTLFHGGIYWYNISINPTVRLYSVKDLKLIKDISERITIEKVKKDDLKDIMNQAFEKLFQKMALEIHNALL